MNGQERVAIVLFNLGGPDSLEAVEPFLKNLFSDPAIIRVPGFVRGFLARMIARRRAPIAREIYRELGGKSPILENTLEQAEALSEALSQLGEVRCFPVMRYWHPRAADVAREVADFAPSKIVLLPLYPQFSTTTSGSSLGEWHRAARGTALAKTPTWEICCYPQEEGFVVELAARIRPLLEEAAKEGPPRLLLSAHGLPKKIVDAGDPYQWQVEQTAERVIAALDWPGLDALVSYQSRVGPLEWIGPSTSDEVARAGSDKRALVIAPVAFVSEHSETLVELDIELAEEAAAAGVISYRRAATVDAGAAFIAGLAKAVTDALERAPGLSSDRGERLCPATFGDCPCTPAESRV